MSGGRHQDVPLDAAALSEDVDLELARRKEILLAEARLPHATHYEALGLHWGASGVEARAAYLDKVRVFHPDRYAGLRLGSYRARLERVFRRITEARDVLADDARRAAYAAATAPPEERARTEVRRAEDERRAAERRTRLARQNPLVARAARVQELVRRGREALAAGRFQAAANDLLLAQGLDPSSAEVAALAADARARAAAARAEELFQRGLEAELAGRHAAALAAFREATVHDPRHARAAAQGARTALALGDGPAARELAGAAVAAAPRSGAAHEALAMVAQAEGDRREARRLLERALELDPSLESARQRLRKLRWSLFR